MTPSSKTAAVHSILVQLLMLLVVFVLNNNNSFVAVQAAEEDLRQLLRTRLQNAAGGKASWTEEKPLREVNKCYRASILHFVDNPFEVIDEEAAEYFADGLLIVDQQGHVVKVMEYDENAVTYPCAEIVDFGSKLIIPGFIDGHVHNAQTDMINSFGEQLMDWLKIFTFPLEAQYKNDTRAIMGAKYFLYESLRNGITTSASYGTIFPNVTDYLFQEASKFNVRIIAGIAGSDRTSSMGGPMPSYLADDAQSFYDDSLALIRKWHNNGRNLYAVTSRFAPGSTAEQLQKCRDLLDECPTCFVQSHVDENLFEVDLAVNSIYRDLNTTYVGIYDHFGLLTPRTLLGHAIHVSPSEYVRVHETGAIFVHSPTSNTFLGSGLFNVGEAVRQGVKMALSTDIGAGTTLNYFLTMGEAYKVSKLTNSWLKTINPHGTSTNCHIGNGTAAVKGLLMGIKTQMQTADMAIPECNVPANSISLSASKLLYMGTAGGAKSMLLDDKIGSFKAGNEADFLVIDYLATSVVKWRIFRGNLFNPEYKNGRLSFTLDQMLDILFMLMFNSSPVNINNVFVMGRDVKPMLKEMAEQFNF